MASSPLEQAIRALVDTMRRLPAQLATGGTHSTVFGGPTGESGIANVAQMIGGLAPSLSRFTRGIEEAVNSMRRAQEAQRIGAAITAGQGGPQGIIQRAFGISRDPRLRQSEQQYINRLATEARDREQESQQASRAWAQARATARRIATPANAARAARAGAAARAAHRAASTATTAAQGAAARGASAVAARAAMAGLTRAVTLPVTALVVGTEVIYGAATACRKFAENVNDGNMAMSLFNGKILTAYYELALGDVRRGFATAHYTEDTTTNLTKAVNDMRDSWFAFDTSMQNITNRWAIVATKLSSFFGPAFGKMASDFNQAMKVIGIGEKHGFFQDQVQPFLFDPKGGGIGQAVNEMGVDLKAVIKEAMEKIQDGIAVAIGGQKALKAIQDQRAQDAINAKNAAGKDPNLPDPFALNDAHAGAFARQMGENFFKGGPGFRAPKLGIGQGMQRNQPW